MSDRYLGEQVGEWTDGEGRPWRIRYVWAELNGAAECIGIELLSGVPIGDKVQRVKRRSPVIPVDSAVLRSLPIGRLVREARSRWVGLEVETDDGSVVPGGDPAFEVGSLEQVAHIYRTAPEAPTQAVARALKITPSAAAKRVARARAQGLLPPTTPGRANALATAKDVARLQREEI